MNEAIIPIIIGLSLLLNAIALWRIFSLEKRINKLTNKVKDKNLEEILSLFSKQMKVNEETMEAATSSIDALRKDHSKFYSKVGIVRFQGFKNTGGDQSFAVALLDMENNGFVLSSLYGRDFSKLFLKPIKNGDSTDHKLTEEEIEAVNKATIQ